MSLNKQQLEAKNFLMGARFIDLGIQSKLHQIEELNDLATRASAALSDMPGSPNRNIHKLEDTIVKIVDLQNEISEDINELIAVKKKINNSINELARDERVVLEERYLKHTKWEDISNLCECSQRQVYRIHDAALKKIRIPESWQ